MNIKMLENLPFEECEGVPTHKVITYFIDSVLFMTTNLGILRQSIFSLIVYYTCTYSKRKQCQKLDSLDVFIEE